MSLEEILAAIADEKLKTAIVATINAEKQKGIDSYRSKDKEVLKYKNALKDLGYDTAKYDNVDTFIENKKNAEKSAGDNSLTIASLNDKLNDLSSKLESERAATEQAKKDAKVNRITADLTKEIGNKFYGSNFMIKTLISDGEVDVDSSGKVVFKKGDDFISFSEGVKMLEEQNKDILKPTQKAGTGDTGGKTPDNKTEEDKFIDDIKQGMK